MGSEASSSKGTDAPSGEFDLSEKQGYIAAVVGVILFVSLLATIASTIVFVLVMTVTISVLGYVIYQQIKQLNQTARTLRENEQRFRVLVNSVDDYAIFGLDRDLNVLNWNSGAEKITQYHATEIIGKPVDILCGSDEEQKTILREGLKNSVAQRGNEIESWLVRQDGVSFLANSTIAPSFDDNNMLNGFSVVICDVTDRRKRVQELRESHRFIQRVTDTIPDILFIYDLESQRTVYLNQEPTTVLGYSPEALAEMGGSFFARTLHPDDKAEFDSLPFRLRNLPHDGTVQFDARLQGAAGEWHACSFRTLTFERAADGTPLQILGLARDVTSLRKAEDSVRRLERAAVSRQRLALLGELSASVAHEFRNPLLGVQHCIEDLRSRVVRREEAPPVSNGSNGVSPPAEARRNDGLSEVVELLEEGFKRMDHVSSRLLRLARSEEGERVPTHVGQCIEGTIGFARSRAQKHGVTLISEVQPNLPPVPLHGERISEALLNLINNALDACKPGDSIRITAGISARNPGFLELCVIDTGAGIPAEIRQSVFEAFFTTKAPNKGTGLGTTIVKKIIEAHGGTIELLDESEEGGAAFRMLLPLEVTPTGEHTTHEPANTGR